MVRTGFGVACAVFVGTLVGCSADVEDPGLTVTEGNSSTATPDSEGAETTEDPNFTASASGSDSDSNTSTTGKDATTTTTDPTDAESSSSTADPTTDTDDSSGGGCGDGQVSPGEQCDGADLQGFDCASLGLGTGTLSCDPVMCTFDTSMCESDTGGTSG